MAAFTEAQLQELMDIGVLNPAQARKLGKKSDKPTPRRAQSSHLKDYETMMTMATGTDAKQGDMAQKKANYGKAPAKSGTPEGLHNMRVVELEAAIPGISKTGYIFSVGKDAHKRNTGKNEFAKMVNQPWTYIEMPEKNVKVGKMNPDEWRAALKLCGYGWVKTSKVWGTDSNGNPSWGRKGYRSKYVARTALNED